MAWQWFFYDWAAPAGATYTTAGGGSISLVGSSVRVAERLKSGNGVLTLAASAVATQDFIKTGTAVVGLAAGGTKTVAAGVVYVRTGGGEEELEATGGLAIVYIETGTAAVEAGASGGSVWVPYTPQPEPPILSRGGPVWPMRHPPLIHRRVGGSVLTFHGTGRVRRDTKIRIEEDELVFVLT